ncbi:hypothetical protein C8R47DRAFT_422527 [Mycena vitilis]|nr:hypothetical protein C8R47DRAFT_422527 [Mycena vitilis]
MFFRPYLALLSLIALASSVAAAPVAEPGLDARQGGGTQNRDWKRYGGNNRDWKRHVTDPDQGPPVDERAYTSRPAFDERTYTSRPPRV